MNPAKKLKILFVTSEVFPFIKTGGLADVSAALPLNLTELKHEVRIVVPKYGAIDERKFKIHEVVRLKDLMVKIGDKEVVFSLRSSFLIGTRSRVQIYFLDNPEYFGNRQSLYFDPATGKDYPDNDERFILLSRSVFELIIKLGWIPDIIHCNDWQCGMLPAYMKFMYNKMPIFKNIKTFFTIHNLAFQGQFPAKSFSKTGLPSKLDSESGIRHKGKINFLKSGLLYSDVITTVSETYAQEISRSEEYGMGLYKVLSKRKKDLYGIINGIDDTVWNPEIDKKISKEYSLREFGNKIINKQALAEKFGFTYNEKIPIIGIISRLYDEKGFDLITSSLKNIMQLDLQLVLLGTGDQKYHRFFENAQQKYPEKFSCYLGFDDELAHLIEAGADMLLMPSKFEPCGLNQLYSLVYGTVPIVRFTGGLADTVRDFSPKDENSNGFAFKGYTSTDMLKAIRKALEVYKDKTAWMKLVKSGMKSNFNWVSSSKKYVELYKKSLHQSANG